MEGPCKYLLLDTQQPKTRRVKISPPKNKIPRTHKISKGIDETDTAYRQCLYNHRKSLQS